ncbi:MAG: hypothetical protein KGJ77_05475 [Acidobacteriota bacterium]|nr:hypothetical protein [Acidobacteriota bacterium]
MVVEYGQSVHTQVEAAPGRAGPAGDTTDMIRSMALSSAELWHDVLQRLAELQESQVILARAIADLGAMVQESLASPRAAAIATGALGELPVGSAPGVEAPPATDVVAPRPDLERSTDDLVHDFASSTGALAGPDGADTDDLAPADVVEVEHSPGPHPVSSAEDGPQAPSRRRFHFRRRPRATAAEAVDAEMVESADVEEGAAPGADAMHGAGSTFDEDWPPLPGPPLDETWEPIAEQASPRAPQPFEFMTAPPSSVGAVGTDVAAPSVDPTPPAYFEQADPDPAWTAPPSFVPAPLGQIETPAPSEEPAFEPTMVEAEPLAGPVAAPPAPYSVMEPPAPASAYSVMEPPAPPAPYSVMEPPAPPAPYSVMEPPAPPVPAGAPSAPAAIVYVPATAETAETAPQAERAASLALDEPPATDVAGSEVDFPPLPPPPVAEEAGSELEMAAEGPARESALAFVGAGPSHSSASLVTEILASAPAPAESGPERPDVLMVSEDLTLVSKSRKRRVQFRLR